MIKKPTVDIVRIPIVKKNGKYPIKLRVTFNRKQKFYPCNIDLHDDEFSRIISTNAPKKLEKDIRNQLLKIQTDATAIIDDIESFSFEKFEAKMFEYKSGDGEVYDLFHTYFCELMDAGRVGNAIMYQTVKNSLKAFKPDLRFQDITPTLLHKYESRMLSLGIDGKRGKSITTVGIYMRHLRFIYNRAISEGKAVKDDYPFGRGKYVIPVGNNIKKALTFEDIKKIFEYPTASKGWEQRAKDFWCFSYLCNGMNVTDILQLKYKDITGDELHFQRAKTLRTNRGNAHTLIAVPLLNEAKEIIKTWGNPVTTPENYIFPYLTPGMTPLEVKKTVQQFTKNMNKYTKRIAKELGIEANVTTYVARHSYATVLKRSGLASIEAISENLGHKNVSTTKNYLASFEPEARRKMALALVAFKPTEEHPVKPVFDLVVPKETVQDYSL